MAGDAEMPEATRGRELAAQVPGCIHTDLLAAGLIAEPYRDRNELGLQWIGYADWQYACRFRPQAGLLDCGKVELVCEGLDTVAALTLNGQPIGEAANMHHPHRFDVAGVLRGGENVLAVTFRSAIQYAGEMQRQLGPRPHVERHPFNFIRKMACNFGWDWAPTLVTAGIWRPIYLAGWSGMRIGSVRPLVRRADADRAVVDVCVDLALGGGPVARGTYASARLAGPDGREVSDSTVIADGDGLAVVRLDVPEPRLWFPRGRGEQALYALRVEVAAPGPAGHDALDAWAGRIGLRTVRHDTAGDEIGSKFTIEVNGQPIFCKGANWVPDDCFPSRVDAGRYRRRLEQAAGANVNMLRVWGGGIYESDAFYDACDELGILVWQDFLFACAAYPEEQPLRDAVETEARYQVARLSCHPSLVLWNGCNENVWGYLDWGWKGALDGRTWGGGYYLDLLPKIVAELDPTRPYWPASPYSGSMDIHPLDDRHGNQHLWDAWKHAGHWAYRDHCPRFASEFGYQGPPTYATLRAAIPPDQLHLGSESLEHHQKFPGGNEKLSVRMAEQFRVPADIDDWLYLAQVVQARGVTCGVEWFRSRQPTCMGTLYWQFNDCWPVTSWSAVDGCGRRKPLWYATRRFYADRLLTIQPEGGGLAVFAVNDGDEPWQGELALARMDFAGTKLAAGVAELDVPARSCRRAVVLGEPLSRPDDGSAELIVAESGPVRGTWFFDVDKNLAYPEARFDADLSGVRGRWRLRVTAGSLLRDVAILADYLDGDARVGEQLVTLLPGESFVFEIGSNRRLDVGQLVRPPVMQCVNRFGGRSAAQNC